MRAAELHFEVSGSGNIPLICTHGWACDGKQFIELSHFLEKDFHVFRPDLPGHGQTPLDGFVPGFKEYAGAIVNFALKHGLDRPILLGHSMGGVLSIMAAASGRFEPRAVINLDGSLPPSGKTLAGQKLIRSWLEEPDFRQRLAQSLREAFFLPSERDARCEAILRTMCAAPDAVLRFLPEQVDELHADRILARVTVPVLYVGSAAPRFDLHEATVLLPQLRFKQICDAGHFLHVHATNKVAATVMNFLKQTSTDLQSPGRRKA
jgi:pimeloyl-ACP methyl ester carboxylesterase